MTEQSEPRLLCQTCGEEQWVPINNGDVGDFMGAFRSHEAAFGHAFEPVTPASIPVLNEEPAAVAPCAVKILGRVCGRAPDARIHSDAPQGSPERWGKHPYQPEPEPAAPPSDDNDGKPSGMRQPVREVSPSGVGGFDSHAIDSPAPPSVADARATLTGPWKDGPTPGYRTIPAWAIDAFEAAVRAAVQLGWITAETSALADQVIQQAMRAEAAEAALAEARQGPATLEAWIRAEFGSDPDASELAAAKQLRAIFADTAPALAAIRTAAGHAIAARAALRMFDGEHKDVCNAMNKPRAECSCGFTDAWNADNDAEQALAALLPVGPEKAVPKRPLKRGNGERVTR